MRKNKGISLISFILETLIMAIIVAIVYVLYEILISSNTITENGKTEETSGSIIDIGRQNTNSTEIETNIANPLDTINSGKTEINNKEINTQSRYYYNQLDSNAKIIYDELIKNEEKLRTGTYEIDFGTQFDKLIKESNNSNKLNIVFQSALDAFEYENPQIFYLDISKMYLNVTTTTRGNKVTHTVTLGKGTNENYLNEAFTSEEQITKAYEDLKSIQNKIKAQVSGDTKNKIKQIHNTLIGHFEYKETPHNSRNIYGALIEKKVVCEGYAKTFKFLLDGIGIENIIVVGTATNSSGKTENHAWNYVKIDEKWYGVDVTWDDPIVIGGGKISEESKYKYFLKGAEVFDKDHKLTNKFTSNSIEFIYPEI